MLAISNASVVALVSSVLTVAGEASAVHANPKDTGHSVQFWPFFTQSVAGDTISVSGALPSFSMHTSIWKHADSSFTSILKAWSNAMSGHSFLLNP